MIDLRPRGPWPTDRPVRTSRKVNAAPFKLGQEEGLRSTQLAGQVQWTSDTAAITAIPVCQSPVSSKTIRVVEMGAPRHGCCNRTHPGQRIQGLGPRYIRETPSRGHDPVGKARSTPPPSGPVREHPAPHPPRHGDRDRRDLHHHEGRMATPVADPALRSSADRRGFIADADNMRDTRWRWHPESVRNSAGRRIRGKRSRGLHGVTR